MFIFRVRNTLFVKGGFLTKEHIQESLIIVVKDWLWARIVAVLLWPLHTLAMKLVYSKIHSAIGISKVLEYRTFALESAVYFAFLL